MSIYLMKQQILDRMGMRWGDFYGQYTALRGSGQDQRGSSHDLYGPCPLHNGTHANFRISPVTGYWYCHSQCGTGGDGISFLEAYHKIDYRQALEKLAEWLALPIPEEKPTSAPKRRPSSFAPTKVEGGDYIPLKTALHCHAELMAAPQILHWLFEHRGLTEDTLARYELGLTDFTWIDHKNDISWKRVTFPVYDRTGRLTNIRKHMFAFDDELDRHKLGKTHPWASGLPADLYPLSALWGPEEEVPPGDPPAPNHGGDGLGAEGISSLPPPLSGAGEPLPCPLHTVRRTDHILLVEGEADALLANQMGFPALTSTLGAGGWRPQNTRDLEGLPRLTILYDNDDAGRKGAKARAKDLARTIPDIRIASFPLGLGKDLTEWVIEGGANAQDLQRIIDDAEPQGPPPAEPLPAGSPAPPTAGLGQRKPLPQRIVDLADVPPPPAELPFLWGAFLNEGVSHWLTGKTGLGKSTFAFNLACALAEGRTLWGIECRARRILYVDMESGDIGRALKIQRLYKDKPRPPGKLLFVREPMRLPEESAELVAYAEGEAFDLIIFDTARRVFAVKDENDNAEVYNRIIPTLDALKVRGIATLTMGHPPKNGGLGARGAGAQEDAGDINLLLTMHRGEVTDADGIIALSITKNRLLGLGQPPLYLKRIGHDQFERVDSSAVPPAEDLPEKQSPRDRCRAAVLTLLESNGGKSVAYKDVKNAMEAQGYSRMTIHRALKELMEEQEIAQPTSGEYVLYDPFA